MDSYKKEQKCFFLLDLFFLLLCWSSILSFEHLSKLQWSISSSDIHIADGDLGPALKFSEDILCLPHSEMVLFLDYL